MRRRAPLSSAGIVTTFRIPMRHRHALDAISTSTGRSMLAIMLDSFWTHALREHPAAAADALARYPAQTPNVT